MEETKQEKKVRKKAYRKARRKATRPWKGLSIFVGVIMVVLAVVTAALSLFDNTIAVYFGGTFNKISNEDPSAVYFASDFDSVEEKTAYEAQLVEQVEGEGATLLMNDGALPLSSGAAVSCFSSSSVNLVYGGTGSGNVDASSAPTLRQALEDAGFQVNDTLWSFYTEGAGSEYKRTDSSLMDKSGASLGEVPWSVYTDDVLGSVSSYGDAAIVVIGRIGGEGSDCAHDGVNYLALDQDEKDMLAGVAALKESGQIKNIIVLLNSSNAIQLDFLKEDSYGIDAVLWIGGVGSTGINAVADILAGAVVPSGRLVDTFCYDNYSSPAMVNFGTSQFGSAEELGLGGDASNYIVYQEGIYVGYKYYETRYEDTVMGTGNAGDYDYSADVAYPFGFGLSYTEFEYSDMSVNYNSSTDQYEVQVTVTNTGDTYAGKETVQVYAQSPYTQYDIDNGVEKAAVALCGFGKTRILNPGESETLTVLVNKRDLASYDAYGAKTYIMDEGDYYLTAARNAHDAVNNVLAAKGFTGTDTAGDETLTWKWTNKSLDTTTYAVSANGTPITNQFDNADLNLYEGSPISITYLSRSDWTGTFPTGKVQLIANDAMAADLVNRRYDAADYETQTIPTFGAKNGLNLIDLRGADFDDPQWDLLLDQMTFKEMARMSADAFHWTIGASSINAPAVRDENGPQGLTASLMHADIDAMACTSEDVMAATFNRELLAEVGRCIADDCLDAGVAKLYGPGNNIHRTPFAGRNFEYYSEDGYLSGQISAAEVKEIETRVINVLMKHFALNDCEENRSGLSTWSNEQAIREIYLKAFQTVIEEAPGSGVMDAFNRFGCIWAGGHYGLLTNVLRGEWGCTGLIITDNAVMPYMDGPDGIMAGGTLFDAMGPLARMGLNSYSKDPVIANRLREATHWNLYVTVNSAAMNGIGPDTTVKMVAPGVVGTVKTILVVVVLLFIALTVKWQYNKYKFKKSYVYVPGETPVKREKKR